MKNLFSFFILLSFSVLGQIPPGYYGTTVGQHGQNLRYQLCNIIKNHSVIPSGSVAAALQSTDAKANGKVWDIYGYLPTGPQNYEYTFSTMACGVYTIESDCYEIAYAWPKAWFNSVAGPSTDLFNIYPADGFVNSKRDNYPYGTAGSSSYLSLNWSKLGMCSDNGYSLTVFEPINDIKGDLARSYFYMTTRYYQEYGGWGSSPATNNSEILPWQLSVLMFWHRFDPVSWKEIQRNDSIYYRYQHNRNPFIDHPEFADDIWSAYIGLYERSMDVKENYKLFPNPAQGKTQIAGVHLGDQVQVVNALGQIVIETKCDVEVMEIDLADIPYGVYTLSLKTKYAVHGFKLINSP